MDSQRKKELIQAYKNRKPEMGILSCHCGATGDSFLTISKDTRADRNSLRCKLTSAWHPNKELQTLWDQHGEEAFTFSVTKLLKYDDPQKDHTKELNELLEECLEADTKSKKMWR